MDRTVGETFYLMFTTRDYDTGAPATLAGTPVVSAYEDNSATQITAGITLGVDHDSVTGLNLLTIVATGANGYEAGKDYNLVITTGTVDSVSVVGEVVGTFSLEAGAAFTRLGAPAGASIAADIATVDTVVDSILVDTAEIGAAGAGLTAIPWNSAWDAEVQSECNDALVAYDAATGSDISGLNDLSAAQVNAEVDTALADIHLDHLLAADYDPASKPGTATALLNELVESDGGVSRFTANALEQGPDTDHTGTGSGLTAIPWNSAWDAEVQSECADALTAYDAATGADISGLNDLSAAAVNAEVDTALSDIGLDHLLSASVTGTDITDNSIIARLVSKEATADWDDFDNTTDSLQAIADSSSTPPTAAAIADAVWDEAQADHVAAGSFGLIASEIADILVDTAEIGSAGAGLTAIPWNASWDAEVQSECADALTAYDAATGSDISGLNDLSAAQVNAEVDTALADIHLDHLLAVDYDPAAKPGTATALLNELVENDGGVSRLTANALEQAPDTDHTGTGSGLTAIPWNSAWDAEVQSECADALTAYDAATGSDVSGLNDLSAAQVNAEVDTALADIHLDHLLAANYDPAAKPGVATALLNELVENDGGVSRFTANALEQGPDSDTDYVGTGSGLTAIPWNAAWDAEVQSECADALTAYGAATATNVSDVETKVDTIDGIVDAILVDTDTTIPGLIAALNDVSAADVLTQVNAALDTAISELGVAAPTATPTIRTALMLLYMALRNERTTTATVDTIKNDAGTAICTASVSDDGTTFEHGEYS